MHAVSILRVSAHRFEKFRPRVIFRQKTFFHSQMLLRVGVAAYLALRLKQVQWRWVRRVPTSTSDFDTALAASAVHAMLFVRRHIIVFSSPVLCYYACACLCTVRKRRRLPPSRPPTGPGSRQESFSQDIEVGGKTRATIEVYLFLAKCFLNDEAP